EAPIASPQPNPPAAAARSADRVDPEHWRRLGAYFATSRPAPADGNGRPPAPREPDADQPRWRSALRRLTGDAEPEPSPAPRPRSAAAGGAGAIPGGTSR